MASTAAQNLNDPTASSTAPPTRSHFRKAILASVVGLAMACTATVGSAAAHPAAPATANTTAAVNTAKIYFGVDGTVSQAAQGVNVARHIYGELTDNVPNARMVTMGIDGFTYADISAAAPGSTIYNDIVRWANTIKTRGTFTYFGFVHEPESKDQAHFGTASQYIAAYQHVVDVMRAQNVPNVSYVWQLTAYGFVRKGAGNAINYYPGDNYVDYVAADAYNWGGCVAGTPWRDLSAVANPVLAFAEAHGKLAMLAEFGSQSGPQRAAWLTSAHQYFIANQGELVAAFYFDRPPTTPNGAGCNWALTSSADVAAFQAIANDTTYFTS
jgi:hypothetical protein